MAEYKVYIAGPMTGRTHFNFHAFDEARDHLLELGFGEVFSPADHDRELLDKPQWWIPQEADSLGHWLKWITEGAPTLRRMLGDDLQWIAENATHMYMLKGWEHSAGARAEHALASALKMEIMYE